MAVWWIRRDLRLEDNAALHRALASGGPMIPLFILDPHRLAHPVAKRHAFLYDSLRQLDAELRRRGSRLITRQGDPESVLAQVVAETHAGAIYAEESYSPFARRRDSTIASRLPLHLTPGLTVHHPTAVLRPDGRPYTVFTAFKRAWMKQPLPAERDVLPAPAHLPPLGSGLVSTELPDSVASPSFPPGAEEARRRLHAFVDGAGAAIHSYATERDRFDRAATSQISPYLRFGMVSPRQVVVAALSASQGADIASDGAVAWLNELIWREFYQAILYHFPDLLGNAFRADLRDIAWENDGEDFAAWCDGRTGFPVVDAAMRQLMQTGWMHNRLRMIAASFLVKDLLIDWRWGERFFMEHLVDGDSAANNGGWQWTAGVGSDAAPYFRIFSPVAQAKTFDPTGEYIRTWLPELFNVPDAYIHAPWLMPDEVQRQADCVITKDYPAAIVDRSMTRRRALAVYGAARTGRSGESSR